MIIHLSAARTRPIAATCMVVASIVAMFGMHISQAPVARAAPRIYLGWPAGTGLQVTQPAFGSTSHSDYYNRFAVDFAAPIGTPVLAGATGSIYFAGWDLHGGGLRVLVDIGSDSCIDSMHLSRIDVATGQRVSQAQRVGLSGSSGNSTGPHLHYGLVRCSSKESLAWESHEYGPSTNLPRGFRAVSQNRSVSLQPPPDKDSDGLPDDRDRCIEVAGSGDNFGCPENDPAPSTVRADLDADGRTDLAAFYNIGGNGPGTRLWYWRATPTGLANPTILWQDNTFTWSSFTLGKT
jgi:hypothetical protein